MTFPQEIPGTPAGSIGSEKHASGGRIPPSVRAWLRLGFLLLFLPARSVLAADQPVGPLDLQAAHRGTDVIDRALLEISDPTESVREFFADARRTFGANPMATFAELPAIRASAEKHGIALLGGPMLGAISHDGARVWVRTVQPAQVEVFVRISGMDQRFGPVASTVASDLTAVIPVTGLTPHTRHAYRVLVDGRPIPMPVDAVIPTLPAPGTPAKSTILFGSDFHKTGLWKRELLARMHQRGSPAFLLLGDGAVDDRDNKVGLHRSDYLLRDLSPGWRELAASTAVYAAWDDHDYFNNDKSGVPTPFAAADRTAVRTVWTQSWNNPAYGFADRGEGIFFRTRIGPCDLIMLDTRFFRTTKGEPDSFLGADQLRWLEEQLAACTAPFIIITSGTMWTDYITAGKDSWGVWDPPARERILSFIEERRIPGVLLLSGDRHGARVMRMPRPSGFNFWEFELGSLGAHPGPPAIGSAPDQQLFGVSDKTFFGECTFDTTLADPTVTIRIMDPAGNEHYQVTLTRSQLTPPPKKS